MSMNEFCLYCAHWNRLDDDRVVGKCAVHGGYRLQYESCLSWAEGEIRVPYKEKQSGKKERDKSRDDEIERLIVSGCSVEDVRLTLHCGKDLIRTVVKERGLTLSRRKPEPKKCIITGELYEQVIYYYQTEKKSQRWIADKFGQTLSAVRGALIRAGLAL